MPLHTWVTLPLLTVWIPQIAMEIGIARTTVHRVIQHERIEG